MATNTSAVLTLAPARASGTVVVSAHGQFDAGAAAHLQRVLADILEDSTVFEIAVNLRHVRGVDVDGIRGLADAASLADQRGAELTLCEPPELICQQLEVDGLTALIRVGQPDLGSPRSAHETNRSAHGRSCHPSAQLRLVSGSAVKEACGS